MPHNNARKCANVMLSEDPAPVTLSAGRRPKSKGEGRRAKSNHIVGCIPAKIGNSWLNRALGTPGPVATGPSGSTTLRFAALRPSTTLRCAQAMLTMTVSPPK